MDELADRGVSIPDSQFKSAIISSTPDMYQATVKALITVYREEPSKLTPEMLIAAIRAEAQGKNFASSSNKSQESANYSNDNFRGRGCGRFRGRGGREAEAEVEQEEIGKATTQQGRNPAVTTAEDLVISPKIVHLSTCSVLTSPENSEMKGIIEKTERMGKMDNKGMEKEGIQQAVLEKRTKKIVMKEVGWPLKFRRSKDSIEHPTIDCSDIAEEAAFVALEHTPPILFNSGCSSHMSPLQDQLRKYQTIPTHRIQAANSDTFTSQGKGTLHIEIVDTKEKPHFLPLRDTLYCPDMPNTLVSLGKLDDAGYNIHIEGGIMVISKQGRNVAHIPKVHGLSQIIEHENAYSVTNRTLSLYEAHCATGHQSYQYVKTLFTNNAVKGLRLDPNRMEQIECIVCMRTKGARLAIPKLRLTPRAENFGDTMHMDVWGPASVRTINHQEYSLTLIDDATYWLETPLLRSKDESFTKYVIFQTTLKTQFNIIIKILQSDQGGEFLGGEFTKYLEGKGTERKLTVHDIPEQNSVAERSHCTLLNTVRAMLISSGLPKWLWGMAMLYATYIWNCTPHKAIDMKTPFEKRFGTIPDISDLHPFGSIVYVKRTPKPNKLGHWLGPEKESQGYYIYWPKKKSITVERNIQFTNQPIQLSEEDNDFINLEQKVEDLSPDP
ncbi:hypothetical protein D9758_013838 [Tetrapyrgos nigripes]|uniref:Integrase catalytic domain-containing protein n=1 Tax=Tetrapyrgos nigripes TaxID=182062 RepID=A0A8H5CUI9_9AGAR|nr:hypothetical protein D9758_013838 [Tetrapyrgos nigripes]